MAAKTLMQLYNEYHARHNDGSKYRHEQLKTFKRVVDPVIGHLPAKQVAKHQLREIIEAQSKGMQYQMYALFSKFFKSWLNVTKYQCGRTE
jgi:hypothetical protein